MAKGKKVLILAMCLLACLGALAVPGAALADELEDGGDFYTVYTSDGEVLFRFGGQISVDDEYISSDNRRYRIIAVDEAARTAQAEYVGEIALGELAAASAAAKKPRLALYCTHTDESYNPSDGTESEAEGGGILDVAQALKEALEQAGCEVIFDDTNHVPHDASAYTRSRRTAVALMKEQQPDMLCDIHRDAVPPDEYEAEVEGEDITRVRIVVGKGNQNYSANEEVAMELKALADETCPGLIKDIYIGKGSYNQDLMPGSLLFEFGAHTTSKERAIKSAGMLAEVVAGSLGADVQQETSPAEQQTEEQPSATAQPAVSARPSAQPDTDRNSGAGKSILWIVLALLAAAGLTIALTVRKGQFGAKVGGFFKELTGIGHKNRGDDPRNRM